MRSANIIGTIFLVGLLGGCSATSPTTAIVQVEKPRIFIPDVDKVKLNDVEWHIIGKDAAADDAKAVFKKTNSNSLFALTSKSYENISVNTEKMRTTIRQMKAQIAAYKKYYEEVPEDKSDAKR